MDVKTISGDDVRCVLKWDAIVGESPHWHPQEQRLYWIDIQGRKVHRFASASGRNETFDLPDLVTSLAFRKKGGLLLTHRKDLAFFDPDSGKLEILATVEADKPGNRFNDAHVDPQGRFWAGTIGDPAWDQPVGSLYRFDSNQTVTKMCTHVICSNGTGWSPDGGTMYHTESFRYAIFAYDFDAATDALANRRIFAEVDRKLGAFPDGLCVDAEGFVWSNQVGIGRIVRYDSGGHVERQIQFPVPRAAGCTFGGDDLDTLFVTSARETDIVCPGQGGGRPGVRRRVRQVLPVAQRPAHRAAILQGFVRPSEGRQAVGGLGADRPPRTRRAAPPGRVRTDQKLIAAAALLDSGGEPGGRLRKEKGLTSVGGGTDLHYLADPRGFIRRRLA